MSKILVACGTGTATAAVVAEALSRALQARGLQVDVSVSAISEVAERAPGHDLVVSTMPVAEAGGVPVIHTLAFLTGVDVAGAVDRIVAVLQSGAVSRGDLHD